MKRYIAIAVRPLAGWNGPIDIPAGIIVHEQSSDPVDTGLLDASGIKLFRVDEREPIGFCRLVRE